MERKEGKSVRVGSSTRSCRHFLPFSIRAKFPFVALANLRTVKKERERGEGGGERKHLFHVRKLRFRSLVKTELFC